MFKIAVFVSGRGSNLKAILDANSKNYLNIEVAAIVSDKSDCPAIETAKNYSIPAYFVSKVEKSGFLSYSELAQILIEKAVDLIVLAGFLKKIPDEFIDAFPEKIINIHPALLPGFGGPGMYGTHVHAAVFTSSAKVSGATVHFVDKIYDHGKIISQRAVDISDVRSPEEIAARVLRIEHELLPYTVKKFSENKIVCEENRVFIVE